MEIKTCEQYVVNRLMELEDTVEVQKELIRDQVNAIRGLSEKLEFIGKLIRMRKSYDWSTENPSTYIEFKTIWKKHDPEEYQILCKMFGLVEPGADDEEED